MMGNVAPPRKHRPLRPEGDRSPIAIGRLVMDAEADDGMVSNEVVIGEVFAVAGLVADTSQY
jgi:hypothetical protein